MGNLNHNVYKSTNYVVKIVSLVIHIKDHYICYFEKVHSLSNQIRSLLFFGETLEYWI